MFERIGLFLNARCVFAKTEAHRTGCWHERRSDFVTDELSPLFRASELLQSQQRVLEWSSWCRWSHRAHVASKARIWSSSSKRRKGQSDSGYLIQKMCPTPRLTLGPCVYDTRRQSILSLSPHPPRSALRPIKACCYSLPLIHTTISL